MSDFWARRKAAVEAEAQAEEAALVAAEAEARETELAEKSDEELLAEAGLREPEALESAEEVQAFLKAELPRRLKTRALRRLWRLNPVLANLDGLVDYGEDFTDSATVVENMQTLYQVGKGMFDKFEEMAKTAEPKDAAAEEDGDAEVLVAEEEAPEALDGAQADPAGDAPVVFAALEDDDPRPVPQRRMRFQFAATEG